MAGSCKWYGNALVKALSGEINFFGSPIMVMLCTSGYALDQDVHAYKSAVTSEVVGLGYTAGGQELQGKSITYNPSSNMITITGATVSWDSSVIQARYAVLYCATGNDATSALLGYVDFALNETSSGGPFTIAWDPAGIFTLTVA